MGKLQRVAAAAGIVLRIGLAACTALVITGCATGQQTSQLVGSVVTGALSITPSADVEQVYYLGSFDPRGQFPPSVYRIRVRGQSSILNRTRFASSWVPAEVVDSLTGRIDIGNKDGRITIERDKANESSLKDAGRGLVMFGPEGVREAPRGHRLVIIMGSSPETVEQAFASALGSVAHVKFGSGGGALDQDLFELLLELGQEREQLQAIVQNR